MAEFPAFALTLDAATVTGADAAIVRCANSAATAGEIGLIEAMINLATHE